MPVLSDYLGNAKIFLYYFLNSLLWCLGKGHLRGATPSVQNKTPGPHDLSKSLPCRLVLLSLQWSLTWATYCPRHSEMVRLLALFRSFSSDWGQQFPMVDFKYSNQQLEAEPTAAYTNRMTHFFPPSDMLMTLETGAAAILGCRCHCWYLPAWLLLFFCSIFSYPPTQDLIGWVGNNFSS